MQSEDFRIFFMSGCARSGTTSLAKILAGADNVTCLSEPVPNLNRESRDHIDGKLMNPVGVLEEALTPRIEAGLTDSELYGEKNVTLGAFIPELSRLYPCKFIYIKRDGRDVVRSLIDWHERMFGTIYRECLEQSELSKRAILARDNLPIEMDESDYSRPRPAPDDIWFEHWGSFSRFQMCVWYWSRINRMHLEALRNLSRDRWFELDYSNISTEAIFDVADFLGLKGLQPAEVSALLSKNINSLQDRIGENDSYPPWTDWSPELRVQFDAIAFMEMQKLGYYSQHSRRYCPENYGHWWRRNDGGPKWYQWMYRGRQAAHDDLIAWSRSLEASGEVIQSVLDVGCGMAVGYVDTFAHLRYVGMDLSEKEIAWCQKNYSNPKHDFVCADIIEEGIAGQYDLVFSQGTIDNSYDMDTYLEAMVKASSCWIYVTAYRGWFPNLEEHRYQWVEDTTCFYNDISPMSIRRKLESLGCRDITISPLAMGVRENNPITHETRIVARVSAGAGVR